jgi:hypothetical protein
LGDYFLLSGSNYSFLVNSASEQASWKRLLRGGAGYNVQEARTLLHKLLEQIDIDAPLEEQLDRLISSAEGLEHWRQIMVNTPAVFRYCGEHALRWDGDRIYLLKKSRMSGMHAELFSYHLHLQLEAKQLQKKLLPLRQDEYQAASGSEYQPCLFLALTFRDTDLYPLIYSTAENFRIQFFLEDLKSIPDLKTMLVATLKFKIQDDLVTLEVSRERILITLQTIAKSINTLTMQEPEAL